MPNKHTHALAVPAGFLLLMWRLAVPCTLLAQSSDAVADNPLLVSPSDYDFSRNPALLERIKSGPHGYFRFINHRFSNEVCHRFRELLPGTPSLNLHGDAHLEQYAVTDIGRGLTDFDDSSMGPALLDLMRFGVSLRLACRAYGWEAQAPELFDRFLFGYRMALNDPDLRPEEPRIVKRLRSTFKYDRKAYFKWVDSLMEPMPAAAADSLHAAMRPYVEAMIAENPKQNKKYFAFVSTGYLRMGIGSALDVKYLVRVRGKSRNPLDDVVLEIKEVRDISGIECIIRTQKSDPFRVLLGQARIAYAPFKHLGYFNFKGKTFWVHSWVDNYKELKIGKSFESREELAEVVYDVGVQLGQGHTKHIAAPFDAQLRRTQLQILSEEEALIKKTCIELADLTVAAWEAFCAQIDGKSQ